MVSSLLKLGGPHEPKDPELMTMPKEKATERRAGRQFRPMPARSSITPAGLAQENCGHVVYGPKQVFEPS